MGEGGMGSGRGGEGRAFTGRFDFGHGVAGRCLVAEVRA